MNPRRSLFRSFLGLTVATPFALAQENTPLTGALVDLGGFNSSAELFFTAQNPTGGNLSCPESSSALCRWDEQGLGTATKLTPNNENGNHNGLRLHDPSFATGAQRYETGEAIKVLE